MIPKTFRHARLAGLACCFACWLGAILALPACNDGASAKSASEKGPPPVPVTIGAAEQKTIPILVKNIGNVEALATVAVKSKVGGQLVKVLCREGQEVKTGDILFEIDPGPFKVALAQARAQLAQQAAMKKQASANLKRDEAQMENAVEQRERYQTLYGDQVISKDEMNKLATESKSLEASVEADKAAIDSAEQAIRVAQSAIDQADLQLGYCTLRAPIDGRLGALLVNLGNQIKSDADSGLVQINQTKPIYVSFALPERFLSRVAARMQVDPPKVSATIPDSGGVASTGKLTFIDNAVDRQTGTIRMKAEFDNKDERLWPGQFVDVSMTLGEIKDAVLIPERAILTGQEGKYCFVVKPDGTASSRSVETSEDYGDLLVVSKGLKAGDRVVLEGQMKLTDGARVAEKKKESSGDKAEDKAEKVKAEGAAT